MRSQEFEAAKSNRDSYLYGLGTQQSPERVCRAAGPARASARRRL